MNTALWIIQGILATMFTMAGVMKTTQPKEKLNTKMAWTTRFSIQTVRLVGVSELLAAFGLILPMILGMAPLLTPLAAVGLALIQLLALISHAKNSEMKVIPMNILFMVMAVFVAYGRF